MRTLLTTLTLLCLTSTGHATTANVTLTSNPQMPIVILADRQMDETHPALSAPWITMRFKIENASAAPVTLNAVLLDVTSDNGTTAHYEFPWATTLAPGNSLDIGPQFAGALPSSNTSHYRAVASLSGWIGTRDQAQEPLDVHSAFDTQ